MMIFTSARVSLALLGLSLRKNHKWGLLVSQHRRIGGQARVISYTQRLQMNPPAPYLKKSCDNKLAKKQVKQRVRGVADSRISCLLVILLFVCLQPRSNKRKCFYHLHGIILSNGFLGLFSYCRVVFKPILVKPFW